MTSQIFSEKNLVNRKAFKMKQKAFFIIFKGLSLKQIKIFFFKGESPALSVMEGIAQKRQIVYSTVISELFLIPQTICSQRYWLSHIPSNHNFYYFTEVYSTVTLNHCKRKEVHQTRNIDFRTKLIIYQNRYGNRVF